MRILRGKSSLEVSSQGFALFVLGLVLATFLGGAVRTILSSDRVHARIVSELKSRFPRNEFQIGKTEILLSRGLWPGFGLRLRDVVFKQDVCGKLSFVLQMPQIVMPINLFSLNFGRVRLGTVELSDAKMHLDYRECPPKLDSMVTSSQGIRSVVAEKGIKPPPLDWEELSHVLSGLELNNFQLTYERNITWKVILKSAEVHLDSDVHLEARLDVQKNRSSGQLSHAVDLVAYSEKQNLHFNIRSEFKEGTLKWEGIWDLEHNSAQTDVQLVQMPLKELSSELFQMGFSAQEIKLKTAWLTCQGGWEGAVDHFEATPVKLRACKLEGAYGRVDLEQAEWFAGAEVPFKSPARFQVGKLQLQPLIESLDRQVLPAVFSRVGVWTGVVSYTSPKQWNVEGSLENAEVNFSNHSVRGKQVIRSAHTQLARSNATVDGKISNVNLQDGEFAGEVSFALSDDLRGGTFDVQIEKLRFSPAIQNILVGGQMAPVKMVGKGGLVGGELSQWSGTFAIAELRGEGWDAEGLEIKSRYVPGAFQVEGHAQKFVANSRWRHFAQVRAVRDYVGDVLAWKDLSARMEVLRGGGTLTSISANEAQTGKAWRARGTWIRDGVLNGTLIAGRQAFALRGEKGALFIHDKQPGESQ